MGEEIVEMARKETITRKMIVDGAFELLREQGEYQVTARKLAAHIGCSTQPIFRIFSGMEELNQELFVQAREYFEQYYENAEHTHDTPFVDLGLAYIQFAKEETNLFRLLFLSKLEEDQTMYDLINGSNKGFVIHEIKRIPNLDADSVGTIFMKIFTFIHGMACMATSGEFDLTADEVVEMLTDAYHAFTEQA